MTEFIWIGPSGHTPGVGDCIEGKNIMIPNGLIDILREFGRIKPLEVIKTKKTPDMPMSKKAEAE